MRLDDTITRVNLAIVTKGLDEMHARHARGSRANATEPKRSCSHALLARAGELTSRAHSTANAGFSSATQRPGRPVALRQRTLQLDEEIAATPPSRKAKAEEIALFTAS